MTFTTVSSTPGGKSVRRHTSLSAGWSMTSIGPTVLAGRGPRRRPVLVLHGVVQGDHVRVVEGGQGAGLGL
ncbi:hypothetical protein [Nonomuraea sp. NPDC049400]|uniref:hypothetical protein n=1 Tax=Nonomuraea sp. NPDC049400 TaxID=3364352 RepID=UPI0037990985